MKIRNKLDVLDSPSTEVVKDVGFFDQIIDVVFHVYFYFQVALENPIALLAFIIILIIGLYIGIKQIILYRKRNPWTKNQKKDLKITIVLFVLIVILFYSINKV